MHFLVLSSSVPFAVGTSLENLDRSSSRISNRFDGKRGKLNPPHFVQHLARSRWKWSQTTRRITFRQYSFNPAVQRHRSLKKPTKQQHSENEDSLAHLSAQLKAHGYITRQLDLLSLFTLPPPPIFNSNEQHTDKQLRNALQQANQARQAEDQAREQIVRCLWNMLGARVDATTAIERLSTELRVLEYDHERANSILSKEREKRVVAEKEAMAEKAKAKYVESILVLSTLVDLLLAEHRPMRSLLRWHDIETPKRNSPSLDQRSNSSKLKLRSVLPILVLPIQLTRLVAQHDQKRRESELASALQRLQRQTSDPLQPKFTIINPITKPGRTPAVASRLAHAGELALLEEALEECDSSRRRAQEENGELRELVGEVEEWGNEMVKLRGVGPDTLVIDVVDNVSALPSFRRADFLILLASRDCLVISSPQSMYSPHQSTKNYTKSARPS